MSKRYMDDERYMIALGNVPKARNIHKFGARTGIRNDRERTVWDGDELYPWDAFDTAGVATVSGADDAGKSVYVVGLDNNYDEVSEEIAVGSTGTVEFKRIFRGYMAGTEANDGDISVTVNTQEVMKIQEGNSQTLMSIYTVPRNHIALLLKGVATSAKDKDMQVKFFGRFINGNGLYTPFRIQHIANIYQNQYVYEFAVPLAMPEKTDLDVRVLGYGNDDGAHVTTSFDLILYEEKTDY